MEHIILIITVLIILVFAIRGWRKGFLGLVYGVFTWIFVLIFMQIAAPIIEKQLTDSSVYTGIYDRVEQAVRDRISDRLPGIDLGGQDETGSIGRQTERKLYVEANKTVQTGVSVGDVSVDDINIDDIKNIIESETGMTLEEAGDAIQNETGFDPDGLGEAIDGVQLPDIGGILDGVSGFIGGIVSGEGAEDGGSTGGLSILGELSRLIEQAKQGIEEGIAEELDKAIASVAAEVTAQIIHVVSIMLAIILSIVICQFIRIILEWLHDLPVLGSIGALLGLGWGVAEGFLVVWALYAVFLLISGTDSSLSVFSEINDNAFLLWIYRHNPILALLSGIGWLSI